MSEEPAQEAREHDLTMHVFAVSAGLVGVCLTAIGLLRVVTAQTRIATLGDDLLAGDALLFLLCCALSFWSFKTGHAGLRRRLRRIVDTCFLVALAFMVAVCGLIAYTLI